MSQQDKTRGWGTGVVPQEISGVESIQEEPSQTLHWPDLIRNMCPLQSSLGAEPIDHRPAKSPPHAYATYPLDMPRQVV